MTTTICFLCVANSSRSQMAEGLARSMLPEEVKVLSAGSQPTVLNPFAVRALAEIGIDISRQRAKSVEELPLEEIDLVITLCAEEVCPVFPRKVDRLHWGLPDPAAVSGSDEDRLAAFRAVRDDLQRRIGSLSLS